MSDGALWNTCTGVFYDSGGPDGAYGNSQDLTATLCPGAGAGTGAASSVEFLSFVVGSFLDAGDQLVVHDGLSTAAPVLATGTMNNSLAGLTFTSTHASGCLTFHWTSTLFGNAAGWAAQVITGPDAGTSASLTLCGDQAPFLLFDALNGDPDVGGAWTGPNGPHSAQFDPATDPGGAYVYTVIDGSLCRDSATVMITNVAPPDPGTDGALLMCNISPPVQLFDLLGGTPSPGGTWTGPAGPSDGSFDPAIDPPGEYIYSVGGNAPCPTASATVAVAVTGEPSAGGDGILEACDTVAALDLFAGLGGSPDIGGTWTDLQNTGALSGSSVDTRGLESGAYTFRYTVAVAGCGSDTAFVDVHIIGGVQVTGFERTCSRVTRSTVISFFLTGGDPDSYAVNGVPGTLDPLGPYLFTSDPLADSLSYVITVTDANGCGATVVDVPPCVYAPVVFVPESFSPNGDGINETFEVPGLADFPDNEMVIFNRWGSPVYRASAYHEPGKAWRGSLNNVSYVKLLPPGTYYYVLDLGRGVGMRKGFVQLVY